HSVFLVGGSRIARYLAAMLAEIHVKVTFVERTESRCRLLSEEFPNALVLMGDGTEQELLTSEHFTNNDAFIALTGRDEDNLLISLYARQHGLKKVIAKSSRENYIGIAHSAGLDSVVSPRLITAERILRVVRGFQNKKGSVMTALYRIAENKAEAIEFAVNHTAHYLNVPLRDLHLKKGVLIAAILHDSHVTIPDGNTKIVEDDRVIVISRGQVILDFNDIYS
ncbi:MAG: NAD-binding protein, partial [Evtepia sp.]